MNDIEEVEEYTPRFSWTFRVFLVLIMLLPVIALAVRQPGFFRTRLIPYIMHIEISSHVQLGPLHNLLNIPGNGTDLGIFDAIDKGDLLAVSWLVDAGIPADKPTSSGEIPLCHAARAGKGDIVRFLLHRGATPNAYAPDGTFPLLYAVRANSAPIVNALLDADANPNLQDKQQQTALFEAVRKQNFDIVKMLLQNGANPNIDDVKGRTALFEAIESDNVPITLALLSAGANLQVQANDGTTPIALVRASQNRSLQEAVTPFDLEMIDDEKERMAEQPPAVQQSEHTPEPSRGQEIVEPPPPSPSSSAPKLTRLRILGDPVGTFTRQKVVYLSRVVVQVRNVGSFDAENVSVRVSVPGSSSITLTGPESVGANKVASYTAEPNTPLNQTGKLRAVASCGNCR